MENQAATNKESEVFYTTSFRDPMAGKIMQTPTGLAHATAMKDERGRDELLKEASINFSPDEKTSLLTGETVSAGKGSICSLIMRWVANAGGMIAVFLMIVSWIASGELIQGLTEEYPHPFAICFVTRLGWSLLLVGWLGWRYWRFPREASPAGNEDSPLGPFSWHQYILYASGLSMVGLISAWTWYVSLEHTPLPSNTAVYQTAPVFVFIISVPVLGEKVTIVKVVSTIICVVGAILVSLGKKKGGSDDSHITHQSFGFAMCLLSTVLYAVFEVIYKHKATADEDPVKLPNAFRFIGLIGVTVLFGAPLFPILHYTGVESFELPEPHALKLILLNCVLDAGFNVSLLVAIMLTSPLFCSVATVLTLPVSLLANMMLHKPDDLNSEAYIGCAMISIGFLALTFASGH